MKMLVCFSEHKKYAITFTTFQTNIAAETCKHHVKKFQLKQEKNMLKILKLLVWSVMWTV